MNRWVEINLNALSHNLSIVKSHLDPEIKIIAVVKANAYGHGLLECARVFWGAGAEWLGVGTIEEAIELRVAKIKAPILVMGYVEPANFRRAIDFGVSLTMWDLRELKILSDQAAKLRRAAHIHLKVDTGMHRLGVDYREAARLMRQIRELPQVILEAVFSHFADAGSRDYSKEQIHALQVFLFELQRTLGEVPPVHFANSQAIASYPEAHFEMVRPGIALYGLAGAFENLAPALTLKSTIAQIKRVPAKVPIGYGRTYLTRRPSLLAILPIGYVDGYPRALSNQAEVLIAGSRCKILGRVCMNQTIADITGINLRDALEATLIGAEGGDRIKVEDLAKWGNTNCHEIVSRIPKDITRIYNKIVQDEQREQKA